MALRTEVIFCMKMLNLSIYDVPCIAEIDFHNLTRKDDTEKKMPNIILVDHNDIFDKSLESQCLVEIIDHHQQCKNDFGNNTKLTFDMVGSCCTLVMQRIWEQDSNFKVSYINTYLYY